MSNGKVNRFSRKKIVITAFAIIVMVLAIFGLAVEYIIQAIPYSPGKYHDLIKSLKEDGYAFVLPEDLDTANATKIVTIVHDCDYSLDGAKEFVRIENESGIRSAFFLRPDPDAWYNNRTNYFPQNIRYFQSLESQGWEIGFHYDCLSRADGNWTFALQLFEAQLAYMREFFSVKTTRAHGDVFHDSTLINGKGIYNRWLYQNNTQTWKDLGLVDATEWTGLVDSTSLNQTIYCSDKGFHNWTIPADIDAKKVMINLHTDWWNEDPGPLGYIFG